MWLRIGHPFEGYLYIHSTMWLRIGHPFEGYLYIHSTMWLRIGHPFEGYLYIHSTMWLRIGHPFEGYLYIHSTMWLRIGHPFEGVFMHSLYNVTLNWTPFWVGIYAFTQQCDLELDTLLRGIYTFTLQCDLELDTLLRIPSLWPGWNAHLEVDLEELVDQVQHAPFFGVFNGGSAAIQKKKEWVNQASAKNS